ncbi:glycosyltransferase [Leifsonia sp. A12D58]|uniref:glycosyltransferase n=1 Tax=Leifsonia sp. A12D58 TaxID=3397674 RepID=UPI0039E04AF4
MIDSYFLPIDRYRQITAIERSPLMDQEFYEVQAETSFRNRRAAVIHFFDVGLAAGLSVTPLFQDEWYRFHTSRGESPSFLSFFFGAERLNTTSPFFDARVFADQCESSGRQVPDNAREAMEQFVSTASDSTQLPTPHWAVGTPTWGDARALALTSARLINERSYYTRPRLTADWEPDPAVRADVKPYQTDLLVSAIMPVRNRAGIIADAIRSVIGQTHSAWELIIVDDGSTDETASVVREFAAIDSRIRLVEQSPSGVCAARNNGLDLSSGEFVAFIDSDNAWLPDFIELGLPAFSDPAIVATHSAAELTDEHGVRSFLAMSGDRDDLVNGGNFIDLNTLITRRSAAIEIGGFDPDLRRWVDYDLVIRLSSLGKLHFVPAIGVAYSHRGDIKRISTTEPNGWEQVVLTKYVLDWSGLKREVTERTTDLVSIVMLTYADWRMTVDAVHSILQNSGDVNLELVVLDNGSPNSVREILTASLTGDPRVRLVSVPRNTNFALGSNLAFAETTGDLVVFINEDVTVESGWLAPLVAAMRDDPELTGAQSVIRSPAGQIESAGLIIDTDTGLPRDIEELPTSESEPLALSGVACIYRAAAFVKVRGFDPLYSNGFEDADLALRLDAAADRAPRFAVAPESRVTHFSVFSPGRFAQESANQRIFRARWDSVLQG